MTSSRPSAYRPLKPNNYYNFFVPKTTLFENKVRPSLTPDLFKSPLGLYIVQSGQESGSFERITICFSHCNTIVLKCLSYSSLGKILLYWSLLFTCALYYMGYALYGLVCVFETFGRAYILLLPPNLVTQPFLVSSRKGGTSGYSFMLRF